MSNVVIMFRDPNIWDNGAFLEDSLIHLCESEERGKEDSWAKNGMDSPKDEK